MGFELFPETKKEEVIEGLSGDIFRTGFRNHGDALWSAVLWEGMWRQNDQWKSVRVGQLRDSGVLI